MVKKVWLKPGLKQAALVALGWIAFTLGSILKVKYLDISILLLAVARVLP